MRVIRARRWAAVAVAAAVLVTGCSSDDSAEPTSADGAFDDAPDSGSATAGGAPGDMADEDMAAEEPASDEVGRSDADGVVTFGGTGDAVSGRQLARTASIILEVGDVEQAAGRVTAAAQRAGGFVSGAEVRGGDFGHGLLTLRVPASRLDATIEDLAGIGVRVVESSIRTEDLTEQLTDLGARIANLERLEAELQLLLADVRTGDPQASQLLQVFERLNQVRGDIERLAAQQAAARDRVSLATINVELIPSAIAPEEVAPEPEGTLARAWAATGDAFGAIGDAVIWLGVTILPVTLTVLGIPALLVYALVVALRRRRQQAPPTAGHGSRGAPPPDPGGPQAPSGGPQAPPAQQDAPDAPEPADA